MAADFRFRMDAAHEAPHQLQDHGVLDDQRAVALLGRQPANLRAVRPDRQFVEAIGRNKADLALLHRRHDRAHQELLQHAVGKVRDGEGVGDMADITNLAHTRERELHEQRRSGLSAPCNRERQHVAFDV
jgi:hypothetical protein